MKFSQIRKFFIPLAVLMISALAFAQPAAAEVGGRPFIVWMDGAQEAPGPGDPDGSGTAVFTLNQGQGLICYELTVENIDPATAAHIHRAPAGSPGPVVVPLIAPASGWSNGCAEVSEELIKEIRQDPSAFYVNVHNPAFPGGAVRGQLSK
jgi:CHRD domain